MKKIYLDKVDFSFDIDGQTPGRGFKLVPNSKTKRVPFHYCMDCKVLYPPLFMVYADLWLSVFPSHKSGIICWECFETRIGRSLRIGDLIHESVNEPYIIGYRLGQLSIRE